MARAGWSTSNYLRSGAVLTAMPATIVCWAKTPNLGVSRTLVGVSNSASAITNNSLILGVQVGNGVQAVTGDGAGANTCISSTQITINTWFHAAAVFASATDRRSFLNGGGKGTDANSRTPSGMNRTNIGVSEQGTIGRAWDGDIADAAIWNIALSDADVLALSKGVSPLLMHPEALVAYWPLIGNNSPENNFKSNANAGTVIGTLTKSVHPRIFMPRRRLVA
jgi:hypothetical protein